MNFTALLDTGIGLTLLYLGAALFVTVANETIAAFTNARGRELGKSLVKLLDIKSVRELVRANPAMKFLEKAEGVTRSYVDPHVLAQVLVGVLGTAQTAPAAAQAQLPASTGVGPPPPAPRLSQVNVFDAITKLDDSSAMKPVLWTLAQSAGNDIDKLTQHVSVWIDRSLTVLGEGYRKRVQLVSFLLGLLIAIGGNIDTFSVMQRLYRDKELRESLAASGEQFVQKAQPEIFDRCLKLEGEARKQAKECAGFVGLTEAIAKRDATFAKLPIGWDSPGELIRAINPFSAQPIAAWFSHLVGWLLTALAVSLGAPFWFDLLNRFVNVRSGIRRPEPKPAT